eukprot:443391_1
MCYKADIDEPALVYHGINNILAGETTLPFYNGIISTTTAESIAQNFSECRGLLWTIKASYSNKFKQMIGISSSWFGCFKNESEFICFNCYIPIQKTHNYVRDKEEKINYLIKELIICKKPIIKRRKFYDKIGFRFDKKWTNKILEHPKLYEKTPIPKYLVIHRLIHELQALHTTKQGMCLQQEPEYDITIKGSKIRILTLKLKQHVKHNPEHNPNEHVNAYWLDPVMTETKSKEEIDLFCRDKDLFKCDKPIYLLTYDSSRKTTIKEELKLSHLRFGDIKVDKVIEIPKWKKKNHKKGILQIRCINTFNITEKGIINANGKGYYHGYGIGQGKRNEWCFGGGSYGSTGCSDPNKGNAKPGKMYGNNQCSILYFGSPSSSGYDESRGGGIIELIADTIINNGKITCNGDKGCSGGTVKIRCRAFINNGVISAKGGDDNLAANVGGGGYGRICIECKEYENKGIIYPSPHIKYANYSKNNMFTQIANDEKQKLDFDNNNEDMKNDLSIALSSNIQSIDTNRFYDSFYNLSSYVHQYKFNHSFTIDTNLKICHWNGSIRNNGGVLQIYVANTLLITETGHINANGVGYFGEYGIGKGQEVGNFSGGGGHGTEGQGNSNGIGGGVTYSNKQLTKLYFGSPHDSILDSNWYRGGGIIELIAQKIINNGKITGDGETGCSGGSIKIRCKTFVNNGIIHVKGGKASGDIGFGGSGRIAILCEHFEGIRSIDASLHINDIAYSYNKDMEDFQFTEIKNLY